MRKKLGKNEKRNAQIGIKVQIETKRKLEFIAKREAHPLSTQIDIILKSYINEYFEKNDLKWSEYAPQEEGIKNDC